jgi:hypothetical protein
VFLSSIVFSLLHVLNPSFTFPSALDIFLAGVFLALLRELTGNLYLALGAHVGWNMGLVAIGVPVSGFLFRMYPQPWHLVTTGPVRLTGGAFGPEGGVAGIAAACVMVMTAAVLVWKNKDRRRFSIPVPPAA